MINDQEYEKKPIISVEDVTQVFKIYHERDIALKDYFTHPFKKRTFERFLALDDVSFDVHEGEFLGIIGNNGSGKSTLLKEIANIYTPTKGKVKVRGKLVPFLELGVGFNAELSARENIFLNGIILGMTRKAVQDNFDAIVSFAEIEKFIDTPLKRFSSGMQIRLAFSIAMKVHSDILLLDEILAVGDHNFQEKSFAEFKHFKENKKTVILVSHSLEVMRGFCSRIITLDHGKKVFDGEPNEGIDLYLKNNP